MSDETLLFDVLTPLGFRVHCYEGYWLEKVVARHPDMAERLEAVISTLSEPEEVRVSSHDEGVLLFYRTDIKRWVCAVARPDGEEGFLITAYPADKLKSGKTIWPK